MIAGGATFERRLSALSYLLEPEVAPEAVTATDLVLVESLAGVRAQRGVLRVFTCPGDVVAAGRWHLLPDAAFVPEASLIRRISGGRVFPWGHGFLGVSLLLPHRSALVAADPLALSPAQVPNRYVRGLLRALERLGVKAFYPGRDLVTVDQRPIAALAFETDAAGRLVLEMVLAVDRPLAAVARFLDRVDRAGIITVDLAQLAASTCLRDLLGRPPSVAEIGALLCEAFATQFGLTVEATRLSAAEGEAIAARVTGEGRSWLAVRRPRRDLGCVGVSRGQLGVLEAHLALGARGDIAEIMLAGDFIANSSAVAALERGLRGCPLERCVIERVVADVVADPHNYFLGVAPLRVIADAIVRAAS